MQKRDRKTFVEQSLKDREAFQIPPFGYMTALIISGSSKTKAKTYASNLSRTHKIINNLSVLGPVEAPIFLLRGQYRFRLLIKGGSRKILNKFTRKIIKLYPPPPSIKLLVDVDPYSFV